MPNEQIELDKKYIMNPYQDLINREMPFTLNIRPVINDDIYGEEIAVESLLDKYYDQRYQLDEDNDILKERYLFGIRLEIFGTEDKNRERFSKLLEFPLESVELITTEVQIFTSLISTYSKNSLYFLDYFPSIQWEKFSNIDYVSNFVDKTQQAVYKSFDDINKNRNKVMNGISFLYDCLGRILVEYDLRHTKCDGPYYFNNNSKENEFFIQNCSIGPVWYFDKGFKIKKGDNENNA